MATEQQQQQQSRVDWEERWQQGKTRWDLGDKHPELVRIVNNHDSELYKSGQPIAFKRALVPGCGSGYDVFTLCAIPGIEKVTGLDMSATAMKRANELKRERAQKEPQVESIAEFCTGNFFQYPSTVQSNKYDLCFDYTFLCAMDPKDRDQWADAYSQLLNKNGKLVTFIYPLEKRKDMNIGSEDEGPPFKITFELAQQLLEPRGFKCVYQGAPVLAADDVRKGSEYVAIWQYL